MPHRRSATPVACARVGVFVLMSALPACVLSEQYAALDDEDGSSGAVDAMPEGPQPPSTSSGSSAGGSVPEGDTDESTGGARNDASGSEGHDSTGRPEDLPDPDTSTTTGPTVFNDDCCTPTEGIGCGDPEVESCVCDLDPYCCEQAWDDVCVDLMSDAGCLSCGSSTQLVPDSCCMATGEPGCPDEPVRDCVCAVDPFCCDVLWDDTCVALVDEHACGTCLPPACCEASTEPGCGADPEIETCVCASDPFCCEEQWDNLCVSEVSTLACGECTWVSQGGGCCEPNGTPGCDDPSIEACVCPGDPFCCQTSWDSLCVQEVGTYGCAMCPGTPGGDTGETGGSDDAGESDGGSGSGGAMTTYGSVTG